MMNDPISRQAATKIIENYCENGCELAEDNWCPSCQREQFIKLLEALPPVQPERKKGRWVKHGTGHSIYYDCSLCGCVAPCTEVGDSFIWKLSTYCPDCGAKMGNGGKRLRTVEVKKMTFEEVKEMFKKSIDTTDTMNQAIENLIQSIYLKGYNDALKHAHCPRCGADMGGEQDG